MPSSLSSTPSKSSVEAWLMNSSSESIFGSEGDLGAEEGVAGNTAEGSSSGLVFFASPFRVP